jgi:hypothetical protein
LLWIRKRSKGSVLAEAVLSCCIFAPILVFIIWGVLEVSYAYIIGLNMSEAAHLAARALADEFLRNPSIAKNPQAQQQILQTVRIPNMVSSNNQFSFPENAWVLNSVPRSVTVQCTYIPGEGDPKLPAFPNPDLLHLREKVVIQSSSTSPLF